MMPNHQVQLRARQHGVVALLSLLTLMTAVLAIFVSSFSSSAVQINRDKQTAAALAQAKEALIALAVTRSEQPGLLLYPDRNGDTGGFSDCPPQIGGAVGNNLLLGKLPIAGEQNPCEGVHMNLGFDYVDGAGERLWYAVSKNLVDNKNAGSFPNLPGNLAGTADWITIRDSTGIPLSSNVAFALFAPGGVLSGQSRTGTPPSPNNFLDEFTVGAITYRNWDLDQDFISAFDTRLVPAGANQFNDRMISVT
ncbi:MAG TPA: hypothetical protein VLA73_10455, partial [Burkholderiales bacterium]|nr:hypothetical protein [Burkholderiales bacterium]